MRLAIIGAGAVGLGSAALACQEGHDLVLWAPSLEATPGPASVTSRGAIEGNFAIAVAPDLEAAVRGADAVCLCAPGWAHKAVFDALKACPVPVIVSSHASLGGLYLRRAGARSVIAWGTTVVSGRRTAPLACTVSNVRSRVDAASVPGSATPEGIALCTALFGDRFTPRAGLLAIQLSNVNPQNHLAMLLCNLTRAERGEEWGNYWGITPAVGALMEALDRERLAVAAAFGVAVRTLHEHFHLSFGVPMGSVAAMAAALDARGDAPLGPRTLDTRYVEEDVPYGVAVTEALARLVSVPAPLHTAGVEMFGALRGRDYRAANPILPVLDLEGTDAAGLLAEVA